MARPASEYRAARRNVGRNAAAKAAKRRRLNWTPPPGMIVVDDPYQPPRYKLARRDRAARAKTVG